jgi:hypothetical protein
MSLSPRARILHAEYLLSGPTISRAVDRAYYYVRKSLQDDGFATSNAEPAEELVAHIYNYLMTVNTPKEVA